MSKKTIIKRATEMQQVKDAPRSKPEPVRQTLRGLGSLGVIDVDDLASKVADAVCARLERFLPICARLAAADTLHTSETEVKVLRRAISEGIHAAAMIREGVQDGRAAE